jgi:hypothetical protein
MAAVLMEQQPAAEQSTVKPPTEEVSQEDKENRVVAANLLQKLEQADDGAALAEAKLLPSQCPASHALVCAVGQLGTCDECGKVTHSGQLVFECKPCNYYVCQTCRPITECKKGHPLRTLAMAAPAKCDGCSRQMKTGEIVMGSGESNWYVCGTCKPIATCPGGHKLQKWATQAAGACDQCRKVVSRGSLVMDCRRCNWFLCEACHPTVRTCIRVHGDAASYKAPEVASVLPQCPSGHAMQPKGAKAGSCDGCGKMVKQKELVMACETCNWYLCGFCSPVKHCPEGHSLEAEMALPGTCDGCQKKVQNNEMVMQCRQCNWYVCNSCHIARH